MRTKSAYSDDFKKNAVKYYRTNNLSALGTAKKLKISASALSKWIKIFDENFNGDQGEAMNAKLSKLSPEEMLQILLETANLSENDLGAYLRSKGFYANELELIKEAVKRVVMKRTGRPKTDSELAESRKKIESLEKELNRKERALLEMTARVFLLKKNQEILEVPEDAE
jgi:transposase-like protein